MSEENIREVMHSYARKSLVTALDNSETEPMETPLTPETPKHAAKKSKKGETAKLAESIPNSHLLTVMERIEKMQIESLSRLQSLETTVKENTTSIRSIVETLEFLGKQVDEVSTTVQTLKRKVEMQEKENKELCAKVDDLDEYKRRWNLRVAGIKEQHGENVKKILIDVFSKVSPDIAEQLPLSVDIAHRLGPRSNDLQSCRRIIVQFLSRSVRDRIWRDARSSAFLKDKKIRIFEDLSQSAKDARNKLWPLIEKARKEGKKAGFRGPFAYVDGKKVVDI